MHRFIRVRDETGKLLLHDRVGAETEWLGVRVARLKLGFGEVDGASIEPAWRSRLEARQLKAAACQAVAQCLRGLIARTSAAGLGLAGVHECLEKRSRGKHHG